MIVKKTVSIPEGLSFSDLKLSQDASGISFDWQPIERICRENGLDIALFRDMPEGNVASLLVSWYFAHLEQGGARDPVADAMIEVSIRAPTRGAT